MLYLCLTNLKTYIMTQTQTELKTIEATIKFIFNKTNLTSNDVIIGTRLISKWKKLSGWIERKEYPIKFI